MTALPNGILRSPKYSAKASDVDAPNLANAPRQIRSLADLVKCSVALNEEVRVSVVDEEQSASVDDLIVAPTNDEEEDVTSTEGAEESDNESEGETVDSEDGEIMMMLGLADIMNNEDSDADDADQVVKGSFRKLWEMLMQWTTPSTSQLVCRYNNIHFQELQNQTQPSGQVASSDKNINEVHDDHSRNTIEIGASRRAGIMNMIRMNISRSISDLESQHDVTDRRKVEKSLANIVNTFDCSGPAADFDMKLWRGMTTILIAIVSPAIVNEIEVRSLLLPKSIATLGVRPEEYQYLIKRALVDLNQY